MCWVQNPILLTSCIILDLLLAFLSLSSPTYKTILIYLNLGIIVTPWLLQKQEHIYSLVQLTIQKQEHIFTSNPAADQKAPVDHRQVADCR